MTKAQIKSIQEQLNKALPDLPALDEDGFIGAKTKAALMAWETRRKLSPIADFDRAYGVMFPVPQPKGSNAGKSLFTSARALKVYGKPGVAATQPKYMETWVVPADIREAFAHVFFSAVGEKGFPKKIFINKDFRPELEKALRNIIDRGYASELKTWDGCYQLRAKVANAGSYSMHAWGLAVDLNAGENGYNKPVRLSEGFIKCFTNCHIIAGAYWKTPDGMHFELAG